MTKRKRAKNEPTKGDLLAQQYRNRTAMFRVFMNNDKRVPYWTPLDMREVN